MENAFKQLMDVFSWVIQSSAYAIVSIAVIAMAQFAGRRWLPARWPYALWLILLIRMTLPFGLESSLSLWNFMPRAVHENGLTFSVPLAEAPSEISNDENGVPAYQAASGGINPFAAYSVIWLTGTLVMIAVVAVNNFRLWRSVRKLRQVTDQSLLELFEDCKQLTRVRTVVGLVFTDRVKSPSLFGCFRPRVLLPAELAGRIPREELRYIFSHELAHLKQGDIWIGWIVAILQSLHWFNPLVWWAFARMRADREVACDALALSRVESMDTERYGGTLIGLLEGFHHSNRLPMVAGILENKAQLKRRLIMIKNFRHSTRREIIAAAALLAVLSIAILTNPQTLLSQSDEQALLITEQLATERQMWSRDMEDDTDRLPPARIGGDVLQDLLIHRVNPIYPEEARANGISGVVVLTVTVGEDGAVEKIASDSGAPLLIMAAIEAVRQWRYSPTLLEGVPIRVIAEVRVTFTIF